MADWTFLLGDLRTGRITAEIPLAGAKPGKKLGASGSMSGTWGLSTRWAGGDPYTLTRPARTCLYALRDGTPWWGGIVWTSKYDSTRGVIDLGAADWWSYFDHRKVLPVLAAGTSATAIAQVATTWTQTEQNQLARNLVTLAQSHTGGDIAIQLDASSTGTLRDRTYTGFDLTDVGEALRQLSQVQGGPDMLFDVAPTLDGNGRPVRTLRLGTPLLGQQGSPWVFETGANIIDYTWPSDGTRMATRAYAVGAGTDTSQLIAVAEDSARYADGWALLEADTSYTTVTEATTLQEHANADQTAAKLPVVLPTLVVRGDGTNSEGRVVGPSVGDYAPGDDAHVVVTPDLFFTRGLDTTMRIVGIDVDPGQESVETVTLTMAPTLDDVA